MVDPVADDAPVSSSVSAEGSFVQGRFSGGLGFVDGHQHFHQEPGHPGSPFLPAGLGDSGEFPDMVGVA